MLVGIGIASGGDDQGTTDDAKVVRAASAPAAPAAPESAATAPAAPATPESAATRSKTTSSAIMPKFVGMGLQSAQDAAQAAGFVVLTSHDSAGRGRLQALDRNWKVCSQNRKAGEQVPLDAELDFGAVKIEEGCPTEDEAAPAHAGKSMPDFVGKGVNVAREALDSGMSIDVTDASSEDRMIVLESNWKVCSQDPEAGAALNGQPVAFTAVKFEESCA